jgi:hypothetical protein
LAKVLAFLAMASAWAFSTTAQKAPDLSGKWVIEPGFGTGTGGGRGGGCGGGNSRGGGLGMGPSPTALVIEQDARTLTVHKAGARVLGQPNARRTVYSKGKVSTRFKPSWN